MIKLRHLRALEGRNFGNIFTAFRLVPNDKSIWIVRKMNLVTKVYECYNLHAKDITLFVPQETLVYEAEIE